MKKILIIGGTGQLGHFAIKHLHQKGHKVTAVGIGRAPEEGFLPKETQVVIVNTVGMSVDELAALVGDAEVVVHSAGADGRMLFDAPAIDGFRRENVAPIVDLVEAMKRTGAKRLIIIGSYYTAMHRLFPHLDLPGKSAYIRSRVEQAQAAFNTAGESISVGILELPYIFGNAPNRGTLWNFYIETIRNTIGDVYVHSGGTACITMDQVGKAAATACEITNGHHFYPIGDANLSYVKIYEYFAKALQTKRNFIAQPASFFLDKALAQQHQLQQKGKEAAYDPVGLLDIQEENLFIDPAPAMKILQYTAEDMEKAIKETVEATIKFA
jgi:nucleoside-diphosphate-sugar epimerase